MVILPSWVSILDRKLLRDLWAMKGQAEIGHQTPREAEVNAGLSEGMQVIVHPSDLVRDGVRVRASVARLR